MGPSCGLLGSSRSPFGAPWTLLVSLEILWEPCWDILASTWVVFGALGPPKGVPRPAQTDPGPHRGPRFTHGRSGSRFCRAQTLLNTISESMRLGIQLIAIANPLTQLITVSIKICSSSQASPSYLPTMLNSCYSSTNLFLYSGDMLLSG